VGEKNGKRERVLGIERRKKESGILSSYLIFLFPLFPFAGDVVGRNR
jgi:hypothetical protein